MDNFSDLEKELRSVAEEINDQYRTSFSDGLYNTLHNLAANAHGIHSFLENAEIVNNAAKNAIAALKTALDADGNDEDAQIEALYRYQNASGDEFADLMSFNFFSGGNEGGGGVLRR